MSKEVVETKTKKNKGGNFMNKKIIVVMMCAGMSVGLAVGIFAIGGSNSDNNSSASSLTQRAASTGSATQAKELGAPEDFDFENFRIHREFSCPRHGFPESEVLTALKTELDVLIEELKVMEKGTEEYENKIAEIKEVFAKISIAMGELLPDIDVETENAYNFSEENKNFSFGFHKFGFPGMLFHMEKCDK